jgi:hypothetical protein
MQLNGYHTSENFRINEKGKSQNAISKIRTLYKDKDKFKTHRKNHILQ